ncbi:hypothetical protein EC973_007449 [Apophysomyces ossiformis]|uniref:Uncharacterized protein n=1 Tax=Apophysomyces ossiformis TaxID=679940 RepID=A0A8H7BRU6_9FUNG|nr:hypothetical protein EC973_007449 [Apophysomyces ossiformis]
MFSGFCLQPSQSDRTRFSGLSGRKIGFSSSFDKYKERTGASRISTKSTRLIETSSRMADRDLSIHIEPEDADLKEFMQLVASSQQLGLFQARPTANEQAENVKLSPISESVNGLDNSMFCNDSIYRSKKALNHFRHMRDTNNHLSESMSSNMLCKEHNEKVSLNTPVRISTLPPRPASDGPPTSRTAQLSVKQGGAQFFGLKYSKLRLNQTEHTTSSSAGLGRLLQQAPPGYSAGSSSEHGVSRHRSQKASICHEWKTQKHENDKQAYAIKQQEPDIINKRIDR